MSNFNGKGPRNSGPMSGKGKGYCMKDVTDSKDKENFQKGSGCRGGTGGGGRCRQRRNNCQNPNKD